MIVAWLAPFGFDAFKLQQIAFQLEIIATEGFMMFNYSIGPIVYHSINALSQLLLFLSLWPKIIYYVKII